MVAANRTVNGINGMFSNTVRETKRAAAREPSGQEHAEGPVAHLIENQTGRLPSDLFLYAALGSMAWSAIQFYRGRTDQSMFVGQWAPSFLLFGIYNKLVKQLGSDRTSRR